MGMATVSTTDPNICLQFDFKWDRRYYGVRLEITRVVNGHSKTTVGGSVSTNELNQLQTWLRNVENFSKAAEAFNECPTFTIYDTE